MPPSAVEGLMGLLLACQNSPAEGTGVARLLAYGTNLLGTMPEVLIQYNISLQNCLFGGYPTQWDAAPLIAFCVIFGLILFAHLGIFIVNTSRGHYFYVLIAWIFYSMMKVCGFGMRAYWLYDITRLKVGLAAEVFEIVPAYILVALNLILVQRLFAWRHPVGGNRWLFWNFMFALYALVFVFIAVIVAASFVPYLHFLSFTVYKRWVKVVQSTAVVIVLYVLTAVALLALSYLFPPTTKDENLYTYQPWWVESFSPFYFVKKGAAQEAEETFMRRNHNHRHLIRVIAATHHHFNMVKGLTNERGSLKHNVLMMIISASTVLILVGALLRCVVAFQFKQKRYGSLIDKPIWGFICWGLFEAIINLMYIIGRVDLRFYKPDILPARVRAIITAEQSHFVLDDEDEETVSKFSELFVEPEPEFEHDYPNQFDFTQPHPMEPDEKTPQEAHKVPEKDHFAFEKAEIDRSLSMADPFPREKQEWLELDDESVFHF